MQPLTRFFLQNYFVNMEIKGSFRRSGKKWAFTFKDKITAEVVRQDLRLNSTNSIINIEKN